MRHFYELHDNMEIRNRWTLGDLIDPNGAPISERTFTAGRSVLDVSQLGRWGGYVLTKLDVAVDGDSEAKLRQLRELIAACRVEVVGRGRALNCTMGDMLVVSPRVAEAIDGLSRHEIQRFPTRIHGQREPFEIINPTRVVAAIDDARSKYTKWTKEDHRPELAGDYRMVMSLELDVNRIPEDTHIFRLKGWKVVVVIDDAMKDAIAEAGAEGMEYRRLTGNAS